MLFPELFSMTTEQFDSVEQKKRKNVVTTALLIWNFSKLVVFSTPN